MVKKTRQLSDYFGAGFAMQLAEKFDNSKAIIVICDDIYSCQSLYNDFKFFLCEEKVAIFPDWETLAYDTFSPQRELVSKRLELLAQLLAAKPAIYLMTVNSLMLKIMPQSYFLTTEFYLKSGQQISYQQLQQSLIVHGYTKVEKVLEHGEFATRGSLIDIFPSGQAMPLRIDLFGDEIDSIKIFDPISQRSIRNIKKIKLLGASEYPLNSTAVELFQENWQKLFPQHLQHDLYKNISEANSAGGAEYFLALFFKKLTSIFSYIPNDASIYFPMNIKAKINNILTSASQKHKQLSTQQRPCLSVDQIWYNHEDTINNINKYENTKYGNKNYTNEKILANTTIAPIALYEPTISHVISLIKENKYKILLLSSLEQNKYFYSKTLTANNIKFKENISSYEEFLLATEKVVLSNNLLSQGFIHPKQNILVLSGHEMSPNNADTEIIKQNKASILDINAIEKGDFIIHEQYGIGQYLGLDIISHNNDSNEYIKILYAGDDKLFIPVTELDQVFPYRNKENVSLAKLGSKKWQNSRKKAIDKLLDNATLLLELYSNRANSKGHKYQKPQHDYFLFAQQFPFNETPDQTKTIAAVIDDLCSEKLTDRLICGDVGFGKTEIAMRAAFLAVQAKLQAVVVAPTTLLARQHYNSFQERFAAWPINIALFSGENTSGENSNIIKDIAAGTVDIIIATHKILGNINFYKLGLLIIDEEHRFGVKDKEKLKNIKLNIDVLTLTATPIPRTLQLAFSDIRDLSIINTPPQARLPIKTYVSTFADDLICDAVEREINRGGQIYYLYNDVAKIEQMANYLRKLLPDIKIAVAHGQMPKHQLTKIMTNFYQKRFAMCICSTIVESGIDIPNANTIIIDRADKLGLAQLHQIRGRVGRSSHQAYAYLFTPSKEYMSADAKRRIAAISSNTSLGSGFQLAMLDMEIRGAGEVLGKEQSGHIKELGFDYYVSLIKKTANAIKNNNTAVSLTTKRPEIDCFYPSIIPTSYIYDPATRLHLYQKLALVENDTAAKILLAEINDLYGKAPLVFEILVTMNIIKNMAQELGITKINIYEEYSLIIFTASANINTEELINIIAQQPHQFTFQGNDKVKLSYAAKSSPNIINQTIIELLGKITPKAIKV